MAGRSPRFARVSALSIRLAPGAEADLAAIHALIAEKNRVAADRTTARILESIGALENFPFLGRAGRTVAAQRAAE